ncbi:D-alanyl-D-alanine carboxypeptidase (penicillin-binding protein 5/6) [Sporobacter termitidis DSM 10068]|uniref:serine-type D-Ala-D-Ala carboxypeptidase n=1 Tax=Sporobacter termitidis DSM 10068 TaxID=1123282 RepID=A0A1M5TJK2_9FIRM|nr:D-alanyl-D-alanine carboxypeptidase family protein [Sporobacter termitidis]SHH50884.1 D-alanyl-D-alanine carboxypeptidase (penicillin-binding protein 5/6) [Sporobacter termitidis DSM 10068]
MTKRSVSLFGYKDLSGAALRVHRKRLTVLLLLISLLTANAALLQASAAPGPSANAAILMESASGAVLYEKNPDKRMLIASTTKILTALVVLDKGGADEKVKIGADFPAVEGSSIYLKPGDELTVKELLYGLLLESGNDAAVALARHVAGDTGRFAELMNARAQALGCKNSHFVNPHGLDAKEHYSSARDLALIAREAMNNETFREIVSTKRLNAAGRYFRNHNKLLWTCPGAIGVKTGFTESAGRSLVSCVEREGMRLICVTLSAPNDWNDHTSLYDWAYGAYRCVRIARSEASFGSVHVVSGVSDAAAVHPETDYAAVFPKKDNVDVVWELPRFVYAPVKAGSRAGVVRIMQNGQAVQEIPLIYDGAVKLDTSVPLSLWEKLKWSLSSGDKQTFVRSA